MPPEDLAAPRTERNSGASGPITPGRLRNSVEMTVQTRHAQRLVNGRRGDNQRPPIIGLIRYGSLVRTIWSGAAKDDPYADWWLLHLEQTLDQARETIADIRQPLEQKLDRVAAMNVGLAHSLEPNRVELMFSNPYAYMGAWLLVDLDELVLQIMTARHVGLLNRDNAERMLADSGRAVRHSYAAVQGYRFTGVTRPDVRQGTRRGQRAAQLLGTLPQAITDADVRPEHAPSITNTDDDGGHRVATVAENTEDGASEDKSADTDADDPTEDEQVEADTEHDPADR